MAAATTATPKNTTNANRIHVIDVLRGFALLGIVLVHCTFSYGVMQLPLHHRFDNMLLQLINYLVEGKFYAIFSFLFGLSFAIQLQSANTKKRNFTGYFIWRSVILLIIGGLHLVFYTGDVLYKYALLGLLLLVANKLNSKVLVALSIILIFFAGTLRRLPAMLYPVQLTTQQAQARDAFNAKRIAMAGDAFNAKTQGTFAQVIDTNLLLIKQFAFDIQDIYFLILGLFLLGLIAGREKLFEYSERHHKIFKRMLLFGGSAAAVLFFLRKPAAVSPVATAWWYTFNQVALAGFYVAAVTLLYWKTNFKKVLNLFSPVGKMGLSTYLLQTVFGLLFFYHFGFDMAATLGLSQALAAGILFYAVQILFATWWMSKFRFGPVEWLWRSLTYFKWQPMLKDK